MTEWTARYVLTTRSDLDWAVYSGNTEICRCATETQANQIARDHNMLEKVARFLRDIPLRCNCEELNEDQDQIQICDACERDTLLDELAKEKP